MSEDAKAFGPAAQPPELLAALRAIVIRCREGSPKVDWLPTIASIAEAALRDSTTANAEGAKALEIARAEGKADGRSEQDAEVLRLSTLAAELHRGACGGYAALLAHMDRIGNLLVGPKAGHHDGEEVYRAAVALRAPMEGK